MTKRQQVGSSWADKIRRGGSVVAAIGVMGSLAIAASGCDTVALISFSERSFTKIHSSGFTPPQSSLAAPDTCNGVATNGEMRLRFVLADNDGRPIRLGESVDNSSVELNQDSVELTESALMEVSDTGACTDATVCSSNFDCRVAPGINPNDALKACVAEDDLTVVANADAVRFIADNKEHQVYGLLMENSGSLSGWNPLGSEGAWDKNGDGDTSDPEDLGPHFGGALPAGAIATDNLEQRLGAVRQAQKPWGIAREIAKNQRRDTYFGLWTFNATHFTPISHVADPQPNDKHWTKEESVVEKAITAYQGLPQVEGKRANVYEAIKNVIDKQYSTATMKDIGIGEEHADAVDKLLVVFVDGYDDMREIDGVNLDGEDGLIKAATDNNVRLFIVHLDPKLKEPGKLRDDPEYPSGQQPCDPDAADTGCKNYEACTKPRGYSKDGEENVSLPDSNNDYDLDQTYCIPRRDEFGRTGPIGDYARLACATGGGYMYVPSAKSIDENLSWTPLALDGLWEATIESTSVQRGHAPAGEPLRVHSEMSVNVVGNSRPYSFSQQGNVSTGADSSDDDFDNRGVVFTAE